MKKNKSELTSPFFIVACSNNVKRVLFVPYALFNFDEYTKRVADVLTNWGFTVEGIHSYSDPVEAVRQAECIFVGGGNTFQLLNTLYQHKLIEPIRQVVLEGGVPYLGSSAGTNVATKNIKTTNDMPITYPPSFDALNLVPFNINPHYVDPKPDDPHKGETREQRINQFLRINNDSVLGLREGTYLSVTGDHAELMGLFNARLFRPGQQAEEILPRSDLSYLLTAA